jgi:choline dehydrogenase
VSLRGEFAEKYDYVIVGAGSAGCVLANRLSANPAQTVCLVEAGPPDRSPFIHVPLGMIQLGASKKLRWQDETTPQAHAGNRTILMPHGRTLGGSSAVNGMVYMRGHPHDYDEWATLGNAGWSFREVLPYFRYSENNETFRDPEFHGQGGPLNVMSPTSLNGMVQVLFDAAASLQIPIRSDFNAGDQDGFGLRQVTQKNGRRVTAATAFLKPARGRSNLRIITGAVADTILLEGRTACGVSVLLGRRRLRIAARREVIISAGAIASPNLLMRSGIGPADTLRRHDIPIIHDLAGVGENLQDHVAAGVKVASRSKLPYGISATALPGIAWSFLEYLLFRRGLLTSNIMQAGGFVRTDPRLERPEIQFSFMPALRNARGGMTIGHGYLLNAFLLRPVSRGRVTLGGPRPLDPPRIDANFLAEPQDIVVLREGVKMARRILAAPAFDPHRGVELSPGVNVRSDTELDDAIRRTVATAFHPVGTCKMGTDGMAVVDPELRVRGIQGLRVVDASIMPTIIGGNTNAPVIMIAEKAADMIAGHPSR